MQKKRLFVLALGAIVALSACTFVAYKEFLRIPAPWQTVDASATQDGRLIALHVDMPTIFAKVSVYEDGRLLNSTDLPDQSFSYDFLDVTDRGDAFWVGNAQGLLELWDLTSTQRARRLGSISRQALGLADAYRFSDVAAGRGNSLYIIGYQRNAQTNVFEGSILRVRYTRHGSTIEVDDIDEQKRRSDSLERLGIPRKVEVDQSTGQVYVTDEVLSGAEHLLTYEEDLSRNDTTARVYGARVDDLEATAGLLATMRDFGDDVVRLEIIKDQGDTFHVFSNKTENVYTSPLQGPVMALEKLDEHCAYLWTFALHSRDDGLVNLLGRHTVCDFAENAPGE